MERIVVDSSVAIKWFIPETQSTEAHALLGRYQSGALTFLAPDLLYAEVGNIVWKKQRFHGLAVADGQSIIEAL